MLLERWTEEGIASLEGSGQFRVRGTLAHTVEIGGGGGGGKQKG